MTVQSPHATGVCAILRMVPQLAATVSRDGHLTWANDAFCAATGWALDEVLGTPWIERFMPVDLRERATTAFTASIAAGAEDATRTMRLLCRDGSERPVRWHSTAVRDERGELTGMAGIGEDLSATAEQDQTLARLAAVVQQTTDSVMIGNLAGDITYVNPAFERSSGYTWDEIVGRNARILHSGVQSAAFYRRMWRTLTRGEAWSGEMVNRRKDGSHYVEESTITPIHDPDGGVTAYVAVKRDITRVRQLRDAAEQLDTERVAFAHAMAALRAGDSIGETACAVTDVAVTLPGVRLAGLVLFENGHGRLVGLSTDLPVPLVEGQRLPPEFARLLRERATQGPWTEAGAGHQTSGGLGALLRGAGAGPAAFIPINDGVQPFGVLVAGAAAGADVAQLATRMPALLELSAIARSLLATPARAYTEHVEARAAIDDLLARSAFQTVYQPIVNLGSDGIVGFEALTRFEDRTSPDLVFARARSVGLGVALEAATLRAAVRGAAALPAGAFLSLNASPAMVVAPSILPELLAGRTHPVVLEVTEHEPVCDYPALREAVANLGCDVRVAVDDAGAGEANLRHLVELRPDITKMDVSLVRGINADVTRQALAAGLLHFATVSGHWIVAEGIETAAERRTLAELGVQYGQGYLLGRPAPAGDWAGATIEPLHVPRA